MEFVLDVLCRKDEIIPDGLVDGLVESTELSNLLMDVQLLLTDGSCCEHLMDGSGLGVSPSFRSLTKSDVRMFKKFM